MSLLAMLSLRTSPLPAINIHPHSHKKGSHVDTANDSNSDTAAQVPAATAQNLFGSLLQSLEQVIGVQLSAALSAHAAASAPPAGTTAAVSTAGAAAATPRLAGSNVSVNA